ncbi:MAG: FtsQ-type POTRA domain-containing protein [Myxococcota bacterium]
MRPGRRQRAWTAPARPATRARAERAARTRRGHGVTRLERSASRPARRYAFALALLGLSLAAGARFAAPLLDWASLRAGGGAARVDSIWVHGAEHVAAEQIAAASGVARNASLASVDAGRIEARLAGLAWVAEARALRLPNGRVLIGVVERVPVAVARSASGDAPFLIDETGTAFAAAAPDHVAALPALVSASDLAPGRSDARLAAAARLARRMPRLGLAAPAEISVAADGDPEGFAVRLGDRPARVVLGWSELDARLAVLVRLLAADLPQVASAATLDLRFADQAVLRGKSSPEGAAPAAVSRGGAAPSEPRPPG